MPNYEYKTVAAPRRAKKVKGVKGRDAQLAHTIGDEISGAAAEGWEYLRTDLFPVEERGGFLSKTSTTTRAVMVFRREIAPRAAQPIQQAQAAPAEPSFTSAPEGAAPAVGGARD